MVNQMRKRLKPVTPRSKIKALINRLWFYSRERREKARLLKLDGDKCEECGAEYKEIHHVEPAPLDRVVDLVQEIYLVPPDKLQGLCVKCHNKKHPNRIKKGEKK